MDVRNVLFNLFRTSCRIFNHAVLFLLVASGAALLNDARAALPGRDGARTITSTGTIINAYTTLASAAAAGSTTITVNSVANLSTTDEGALEAGDLLMIYQAQGADIDTTDTASYGNVTNYNSSGLYEFITVGAINSNAITIGGTGGAGSGACSTLTNSYASGAQVIRVPQYTTLTIGAVGNRGSITAPAWNGITGGVVAVHVQGAMTVVRQDNTNNAAVFVNGRGFRGGVAANRTVNYGQTGFRSTDANLGAEKGESIAGSCTLYNSSLNGCYQRGAPANGGGGGNNHNAGGGGGANGNNGGAWTGMGNPDTSTSALQNAWACDDGTAGGGVPPYFTNGAGGGRGGYTYSANQNDPQTVCPSNTAWGGDNRRQVGGYGGRPLDTASGTRFFFGGGGGAGEMNNSAGGSGGPGGGLIFIIAGSFVDSTRNTADPVINADGAAGADTTGGGNDAPGGGGGGGTIVLVGGTVPNTFTLNANGGAGGDQTITTNEAEGPGGGGGGGVIAITGGTPTRNANGGANGTTNSAGLNPLFAPNGATRGWPGQANATAPSSTSRPLCGATLAVVSSFQVGSDGVVEWETTSEVGTVGFNLLRQNPASGEFVQVNDNLLPGLLTAPQGGVYRYPDPGVSSGGTYTYLLQEVEARGAIHSYGPFTVTVGVGRQISHAERARPLAAAEATPRADGYERAAHAPTGRTVSPLAARSLAATTQASEPHTAIRIQVEQEGVYQVSAEQIAAKLGVTPSEAQNWIQTGKLRLRNKGQPVAWMADPSGNQLYFYGQPVEGVDSVYSRFNVYWLDRANGLKMNVLAGSGPAPAASTQPFQSSIRIEENHYAFPYLVTNPDADFWYWDYVVAGGYTPSFVVPTPGAAAAGTATLRAYLQGGTALVTGNRHHAQLLVNGVEVGHTTWEGITPHVLTATFNSTVLADGNNTVTVRGVLDPGVSFSTFAVNGFDLDYPRAYQAVDNRLRLRGAGNPVVTVGGFNGSNIAVLNISDPRQPQWLAATTVPPAGGSVSFVPATPTTDYLAAVVTAPASVEGAAASTLKTQNSGADYLVLAPGSLRAGASALANHRGGKVVELQDIYDAFNHGIANPNAIRDFLRYAYRNWQPRPRHVALVGKGTIDPKDYQRLGTNLFPVLMAATPDGLFAADNRYADFNNNGVPELAIGRIPALTVDDMTQYVAKLQTYESGGPTATALLVADNPDDAGNFTTDSDAIRQSLLAKGVAAKPIYHQAGTAANSTRQGIIDSINAGVGVINYVGHAGITQLANEGLLSNSGDNENVSKLTNSQLPLFLALTCYVGNGSIPGFDSLTEALLWRLGGGIVAALAPTGMSDNAQAHLLNLSIVDTLFSGGANPTLGEATNAALTNLARKGGQRYMLDIYQVFGDPALYIHP